MKIHVLIYSFILELSTVNKMFLNEILSLILSFLQPWELAPCRRVCRAWRDGVTDDPRKKTKSARWKEIIERDARRVAKLSPYQYEGDKALYGLCQEASDQYLLQLFQFLVEKMGMEINKKSPLSFLVIDSFSGVGDQSTCYLLNQIPTNKFWNWTLSTFSSHIATQVGFGGWGYTKAFQSVILKGKLSLALLLKNWRVKWSIEELCQTYQKVMEPESDEEVAVFQTVCCLDDLTFEDGSKVFYDHEAKKRHQQLIFQTEQLLHDLFFKGRIRILCWLAQKKTFPDFMKEWFLQRTTNHDLKKALITIPTFKLITLPPLGEKVHYLEPFKVNTGSEEIMGYAVTAVRRVMGEYKVYAHFEGCVGGCWGDIQDTSLTLEALGEIWNINHQQDHSVIMLKSKPRVKPKPRAVKPSPVVELPRAAPKNTEKVYCHWCKKKHDSGNFSKNQLRKPKPKCKGCAQRQNEKSNRKKKRR